MNDFYDIYNEDEEEDLEHMKYLTFTMAERLYALPITDIIQIVENQVATPVLEYPEYVPGVINSKGRVVPVIDLRKRFSMPAAEATKKSCIIISSVQGIDLGFLVDGVDAVVQLQEDMISPPPAITNEKVTKYITGVATFNKNLIILLDFPQILDDNALDIIKSN